MKLLDILRRLLSDNRGEVSVGTPPADTSTDPAARGSNSSDAAGSGPGDQDGGEGDGDASWLDVLPDDMAKDPEIAKYKTPDEFYKAYRNKVELLGRKGGVRPDTPADYKFTPPEGLHESINITEESKKEYSELVHKLNLDNAQADGVNSFLMKKVDGMVRAQIAAEQAAIEKTSNELRQAWGTEFEAKRDLVAKNLMKVGGQELIDSMGGANGLGNNPHLLKSLEKIFSMMGEDSIGKATTQGSSTGGALDTARARLKEIETDTKSEDFKALYDTSHPNHKKIVAERSNLYETVYGSGATA